MTSSRDRHLFGTTRKRILSLDGGGVRGAISVAFLERIEALLREQHGGDARLCDHFDLIGGTSTGAVIAGALALGLKVEQVKEFYLRIAPQAFRRRRWSVPVLQAKFDSRALRREIEAVVGDRDLGSEDLVTGLAIVAKRLDTGSPWILSNNPRSPYWDDGHDADGRPYLGNKRYRLSTLVRASTAAPHFFDPEIIPIFPQAADLPEELAKPLDIPQPLRFAMSMFDRIFTRRTEKMHSRTHGLFVDGGVSPYVNPCLALLQLVTLSRYGLAWPLNPDNLTVVSVGTGTHRPRLSFADLGFARFPKLAFHALTSIMTDAEMQVLMLMQWMGQCPSPWPINSEVGDVSSDAPPGGKMFRFLRFDVRLEADWLKERLGIVVSSADLENFRRLDELRSIHRLYEIGQVAATKQIKAEILFPPSPGMPHH